MVGKGERVRILFLRRFVQEYYFHHDAYYSSRLGRSSRYRKYRKGEKLLDLSNSRLSNGVPLTRWEYRAEMAKVGQVEG